MSTDQDLIAEAQEFVKYGSDLNPVEADRLIGELCAALSRAAAPEAVAKVRELHRPVEIEPSSTICHECSHQLPSGDYAEKVTEWPCATLDALGPAPEPEWEPLPVGGETDGELHEV